jgi:GntR family transcriptional regulator
MPGNQVDRENGIPLYIQIRESLRERFREGEYEVGALLPSEEALAREYGVSRMTLRHALDDLVKEGLIIRKHGVGTVVSSTRVVRDYSRLTSFFRDARQRGLEPHSRVDLLETIPADDLVAGELMIEPGEEVFHILRRRFLEEEIIALHELFIPAALCPWIPEADLETGSLYDLYDQHDLRIEWGKQIVEARAADPEAAEKLEIEPGSPVLYSKRISLTKNNLPVERVIAVSPGDRFSLNLVMRR